MRSKSINALLFALLSLTLMAAADIHAEGRAAIGQLKVVELAEEATPSQIVLPSGIVGTLVVTTCNGCPPLSLVSSSSTRWQIGKDAVTFAAMRAHLAANRAVPLTLFYTKNRRELTRVVAMAR
jgi:hypothetical protein